MTPRILAFVAALSLLGGAAAGEESSYNKGVSAYLAKNYAEARLHWSRATEEGEVYALNNLGYLLYYGLGGEADPKRAVSLWRKGALAGHSEAQWHLGKAFEDGKGVAKSYTRAYAWYRCALASAQAAAKQDPKVENKIAQDVETSIVVLVDKLSPRQFESAARLGDEYVRKYVKSRGL
jgi:TPR repeat protein